MKVKRQFRFLRLEDGREVLVPGWLYSTGTGEHSFHFSYAHSYKQKKVVFTDSHTTDGLVGDDWVPVSSTIPQTVTPRPGLEDGLILTIEDYASVFMKGDQVVGSAIYQEELKRIMEKEKIEQVEHHCESETECELQLEEALIGKDILAPINYIDE
jgi:hypothetical protein